MDAPDQPVCTLRTEMLRMALLCGLEDPWAFAGDHDRSGVGCVTKKQAEQVGGLWTREPDQGTGRTTRIILLALLAVEAGNRVRFVAPTLSCSKWITDEARRMACVAKLMERHYPRNLQPGEVQQSYDVRKWIRQPVSERMLEELERGNYDGVLTFRDHSYQRTLTSRSVR